MIFSFVLVSLIFSFVPSHFVFLNLSMHPSYLNRKYTVREQLARKYVPMMLKSEVVRRFIAK